MNLCYIKDSDVPVQSYNNYCTYVKVVRIIDGDTVVITFYDKHGILVKCTARLAGIDTPEMTKQPVLAKQARNYLINLSTNVDEIDLSDCRSSKEMQTMIDTNTSILYAKMLCNDKYGRVLVELYFRPEECGDFTRSINQMMLTSRFAKQYDGKKS